MITATNPPTVIPGKRSVRTIAAAAETPERPFLGFPSLIDLGGEVLVSFKHGEKHLADPGATLGCLRIDPETGGVRFRFTLAEMSGQILQMGEWVRFSNGDIVNYIDAQNGATRTPRRIGLRAVRSTDGGRTFGSLERLGPVDGVEYGYALEAVTRENTTWMLVMTFAHLPGGKLVHQASSEPGSVDVIRSDDHGRTWRFVRSLTRELGGEPINEATLIACEGGFVISARSYDNRQWLARTGPDFKLVCKVDLRATCDAIASYVGRPRLFARDGGYYLLGRNWIDNGPMRLSLFEWNPDTLGVARHILLDNAEGANVVDGYYAQPYWRRRDGRAVFNIVTYKRFKDNPPDLLHLSFDWAEIAEK